jgi:hypothetical protein
MAAPYIAVCVFWFGTGSAWLTLLAYHAQIVAWWAVDRLRTGEPLRSPPRPRLDATALLILPAALAGPALYVLLPYVTRTDLAVWLATHGLSGVSLTVMVAYFGLVHPFIEQLHWTPLRERTPFAHVAFAGYHVAVLYSLLTLPWLALCLVVLLIASLAWRAVFRRTGSILGPVASHVAADLGIVLVAWLRV